MFEGFWKLLRFVSAIHHHHIDGATRRTPNRGAPQPSQLTACRLQRSPPAGVARGALGGWSLLGSAGRSGLMHAHREDPDKHRGRREEQRREEQEDRADKCRDTNPTRHAALSSRPQSH